MAIFRNPSVLEDLSTVFAKCDACGMTNLIERTPGGGEYAPSSTVDYTDPVTGRKFYTDAAPANGCAFCGSPNWNAGGSLGTLRHPRWL